MLEPSLCRCGARLQALGIQRSKTGLCDKAFSFTGADHHRALCICYKETGIVQLIIIIQAFTLTALICACRCAGWWKLDALNSLSASVDQALSLAKHLQDATRSEPAGLAELARPLAAALEVCLNCVQLGIIKSADCGAVRRLACRWPPAAAAG